MKISIIIPALNEESTIRTTLESAKAQAGPRQIITVDGGSTDRTTSIASEYGQILVTRRGRAIQMNSGVDHAIGEVLVFLHADTTLSKYALPAIRHVLADPTVAGGCFRLQFDKKHFLLNLYSKCTRIPAKSICYGDRGIFVRREVFDDIGGFRVQELFEDLEMVKEIAKRGTFYFMPDFVTTDSRRFLEGGIARQQLRNVGLWMLYSCGVPAHKLSRYYAYS